MLELLTAIPAGLEYLQDISLAAHPLDKDLAVADGWMRILQSDGIF